MLVFGVPWSSFSDDNIILERLAKGLVCGGWPLLTLSPALSNSEHFSCDFFFFCRILPLCARTTSAL